MKLRRIEKRQSKKAAMEMSVGTIVTIVLLVTVLVLGLVLTRTIFTGGVKAVDQINDKVTSEIDNLFITDEKTKLSFSPNDRKIKLEQDSLGLGFAFNVRNNDNEAKRFRYTVAVDPAFEIRDKCSINAREADQWPDITSGSLELGVRERLEEPELILFTIPENAPQCTIPYIVRVTSDGEFYTQGKVFVTILQR
jgi:hypothetical protein